MQLAGINASAERYRRWGYGGCPLCDDSRFSPVKSVSAAKHPLYDQRLPEFIHWVRCVGCNHVFTNGYFGQPALDILFSRTQPSQEPGYDIENQRRVAAEMVERVVAVGRSWTGRRGRWLDVGFGSGSLLTTAVEYGFEAVGLDLRPGGVEVLRAMGYDARCCAIESLDADEFFDVISMCDVLEHVPFPAETLKAARMRLAGGGALLVSMPNSDCFVWKALDATGANPYWAELEHYHNFSRDNLYRLLRRHGLEPVSYGISKRYRACMEVISIRDPDVTYV
jgi:protein O-GlcNAc transferase